MLGTVHRCAPSRALALLLVIAFTGAPRVAFGVAEAAHAGEHRCACAARGTEHACDCPICKAAKARAKPAARDEAADAKVPPCHRKAVAAAPEPAPLPDDVPCVSGACGDPQGPRAVPTGLEPFTLPQVAALPGFSPAPTVHLVHALPPGPAPAPDVPPPRS